MDTRGTLTRQSRLVAALCMSVDSVLYVTNLRKPAFGWVDVVAIGLILLVDAALASSAKRSGLVAVGVAAVQIVIPLLLDPGSHHICNTGGMMAAYRVGAWLPAGPGLLAIGALAVADVFDGKFPGPGVLPLAIAITTSAVLPWIVGRHTTTRSAYIADLERRADRQEHAAQTAIRRALAEERSSIARDLHDMISHHVSAIGVHAGAARLGMGADGNAAAQRSLSAVETASRSAMTDLRRLLDLLHGKDDSQHRQPGMGNADELLAGVRAAGLPVTVTTTGAPLDLPGSVDIALYRIFQEALTNALRHGDGAAEVALDHRSEEIILTVTNPLRHNDNSVVPGSGLTGIRDRVALFGGEATFGPSGDRWALRVSLPTEELV
ncbi:histidine kinase [Allokutzneria sp. A3M-2-11 16]|uniref:sensor histidine kinase n=1 Tax=Allokutzneria sp. A3M-2-11 16 TaxID=2962043 RepID=UPI0020B65FEA|nr:histidine kinase [Allokutzneria sp. A3M-2-11 16]MCP3804069.1 histidine kinase [Allokutzneria sp. A3M-2-11 16]